MASGHRRVPHPKAGHMAAPTSDSATGLQSPCQHGAVLRQNYKALIEAHAVNVIGPDPCDVGGLAEIKWIAEYADLRGIAMAPHVTANGIIGLAALIQVCATMPDNLIAFEYPARFEPFWYDITEGFDEMPVKGGLITVPDRPGLGVNLIARKPRST